MEYEILVVGNPELDLYQVTDGVKRLNVIAGGLDFAIKVRDLLNNGAGESADYTTTNGDNNK